MFEKVNPSHPDKIADRIAGAIVDYCYTQEQNPRVAVEVLIGHGTCTVLAESSVDIPYDTVRAIVWRIAHVDDILYRCVPQDSHLSENQRDAVRCGDNGIFRGVPVSDEEQTLTQTARIIYQRYGTDGKYIIDGGRLILCQSHSDEWLGERFPDAVINPLGDWTGGPDVDSGATNRKLGSDMGRAVTGGGLCLSGDTEYIGEDLRWHRIDSYDGGKVGQWNDGCLEFVHPERYIVNKNDELIRIWNSSKLSMCVTPEHDVLIETSKGNMVKRPARLMAEKLEEGKGNAGYILHTFAYPSTVKESRYASENEYRLQVAFCADGSLLTGSRWGGRIRVKKERKKELLRRYLTNRPYKESEDGDYSIFWVNPPVRSKSLYECFREEDWTVLREEVFRWDGDEERKLYRTTHKEDADFMQFVLACGGKAATIIVGDRRGEEYGGGYERRSVEYVVHAMNSGRTALRESKGTRIKVEHMGGGHGSYCFNVPSHNLIVRHDNRIFITGNCGKDLSKADVSVNIWAHLEAQRTGRPQEYVCAIGDETVGGIPYAEIVKTAREYIKLIGGFEKFAEWGLIR